MRHSNGSPVSLRLWRFLLIVTFLPVMIWNVLKTIVSETRSACWHIAHEPKLVWEEWIDAYRKGPPQ